MICSDIWHWFWRHIRHRHWLKSMGGYVNGHDAYDVLRMYQCRLCGERIGPGWELHDKFAIEYAAWLRGLSCDPEPPDPIGAWRP